MVVLVSAVVINTWACLTHGGMGRSGAAGGSPCTPPSTQIELPEEQPSLSRLQFGSHRMWDALREALVVQVAQGAPEVAALLSESASVAGPSEAHTILKMWVSSVCLGCVCRHAVWWVSHLHHAVRCTHALAAGRLGRWRMWRVQAAHGGWVGCSTGAEVRPDGR